MKDEKKIPSPKKVIKLSGQAKVKAWSNQKVVEVNKVEVKPEKHFVMIDL